MHYFGNADKLQWALYASITVLVRNGVDARKVHILLPSAITLPFRANPTLRLYLLNPNQLAILSHAAHTREAMYRRHFSIYRQNVTEALGGVNPPRGSSSSSNLFVCFGCRGYPPSVVLVRFLRRGDGGNPPVGGGLRGWKALGG